MFSAWMVVNSNYGAGGVLGRASELLSRYNRGRRTCLCVLIRLLLPLLMSDIVF